MIFLKIQDIKFKNKFLKAIEDCREQRFLVNRMTEKYTFNKN